MYICIYVACAIAFFFLKETQSVKVTLLLDMSLVRGSILSGVHLKVPSLLTVETPKQRPEVSDEGHHPEICLAT